MPSLRSQLRWYYQSLIRPRDPADVIAGRVGVATVGRDLPVPEGRRWWQQPAVIAIGAAAAVLVLIGGTALLTLQFAGGGPADHTAPVTVPVTTTVAPTSTTATNPGGAGLVWGRVPDDEAVFGGAGSQEMSSVVVGGPGLVAVGSDESGGDPDSAVWVSADGSTWARLEDGVVLGGAGDQRMDGVVAGGPGLVAFGGDDPDGEAGAAAYVPAVWVSADGLTWERVPLDGAVLGEAQHIAFIAAGGPGLVAVGDDRSGGDSDAAVWVSADGYTWARVPHDEAVFGGTADQLMSSVTFGGPGLVAVGSEIHRSGATISDVVNAAVWASADGLTWMRVPHDEAAFADSFMNSVTAGGPGLVAAGGWFGDDRAAPVWTSTDGLTWARVPHEEDDPSVIWSVVPGGPGLVAAGGWVSDHRTAAVWTSTDGLTWERVFHDNAGFVGPAITSVAAAAWGLVAVGLDGPFGEATAVVWVSPPPGG